MCWQKYNNKVVEYYIKNKDYKEGMDILYKGIPDIVLSRNSGYFLSRNTGYFYIKEYWIFLHK